MTGSEWRVHVEALIEQLEHDLNWEYKPPEPLSQYGVVLAEKAQAEIRVSSAKLLVSEFKNAYLNRETCDDFDE